MPDVGGRRDELAAAKCSRKTAGMPVLYQRQPWKK
jgi:hypothetical protein